MALLLPPYLTGFLVGLLTDSFHPECAHSAQCAPFKHHFDECVERVTRQEEDEDYKGPKEDCVEECKSTR